MYCYLENAYLGQDKKYIIRNDRLFAMFSIFKNVGILENHHIHIPVLFEKNFLNLRTISYSPVLAIPTNNTSQAKPLRASISHDRCKITQFKFIWKPEDPLEKINLRFKEELLDLRTLRTLISFPKQKFTWSLLEIENASTCSTVLNCENNVFTVVFL